jgi:hypothetical protein
MPLVPASTAIIASSPASPPLAPSTPSWAWSSLGPRPYLMIWRLSRKLRAFWHACCTLTLLHARYPRNRREPNPLLVESPPLRHGRMGRSPHRHRPPLPPLALPPLRSPERPRLILTTLFISLCPPQRVAQPHSSSAPRACSWPFLPATSSAISAASSYPPLCPTWSFPFHPS